MTAREGRRLRKRSAFLAELLSGDQGLSDSTVRPGAARRVRRTPLRHWPRRHRWWTVRRFDDLDERVNAAPNPRLVGPVLDVAGGARGADHVLDRLRSPVPTVARRLR